MNKLLFFIMPLALGLTYISLKAQHHPAPPQPNNPLSFSSVISQSLKDPELKNYKMISQILTVIPGGMDTVSHRHTCDLFGYVLEGEIQIGLNKNAPQTFKTGQMFYEEYKILHHYLSNPDREKPCRILLLFIIKDGSEGYVPEYKSQK